MIKILIADDEKHALDRLKELLGKHKELSIEAEAKNGDEVIQSLVTQDIDAAFLDINMPGVSVFKTIPSLKNPPVIIFQTAYSEYAVDAFGINALDYLLKPISEERFNKTIEKLKNKLKNKRDAGSAGEKIIKKGVTKISVKSAGAIRVIPLEDIYKITFEEGFSFIYTNEGRFLSDKYLNYFDDLLKDDGFYRASRTEIINLKYISTIHPMFKGSYIVELTNNMKVKLSRRRAKSLKEIIDF